MEAVRRIGGTPASVVPDLVSRGREPMRGRPFRVTWQPQDTPGALKASYHKERDIELRTRLHGLWLLREGRPGAPPPKAAAGCGPRSVRQPGPLHVPSTPTCRLACGASPAAVATSAPSSPSSPSATISARTSATSTGSLISSATSPNALNASASTSTSLPPSQRRERVFFGLVRTLWLLV